MRNIEAVKKMIDKADPNRHIKGEAYTTLFKEICNLLPKAEDNPNGFEAKPDRKGTPFTDIEVDLHLYLLQQAQGKGFCIPWMYGGNSQEIVKKIVGIVQPKTTQPKPSASMLLTVEKIHNLYGGLWEQILSLDIHKALKAQRDLTASIKDPEINKLKDEIEALHLERGGEVWYWQGDGNDDIESLTCPILIEPEVLKAEFKARTEGLRNEKPK